MIHQMLMFDYMYHFVHLLTLYHQQNQHQLQYYWKKHHLDHLHLDLILD